MLSIGSAGLRGACPEVFRVLYSEGIGGVDLQCDDSLTKDESFRQLMREIEAGRLVVTCVSRVHDVERLSLAGADRDRAEAAGYAAINLAVSMSVTTVRLFFGCISLAGKFYGTSDYTHWSGHVRELAQRASPLIESAASRGVAVVVEPHPRQAIFSLDDLQQFRRTLLERDLDVGLVLDPANIRAGGLDPVQYLECWGSPSLVHLKDVEIFDGPSIPNGPGWRRYGAGPHARFRSVGDGDVDWERLSEELTRSSFQGPVVLELEDPLVGVPNGIRQGAAAYRRLFSDSSSLS